MTGSSETCELHRRNEVRSAPEIGLIAGHLKNLPTTVRRRSSIAYVPRQDLMPQVFEFGYVLGYPELDI